MSTAINNLAVVGIKDTRVVNSARCLKVVVSGEGQVRGEVGISHISSAKSIPSAERFVGRNSSTSVWESVLRHQPIQIPRGSNTMKQQLEYHASLSEGIDRTQFLSQGRVKVETSDSCQFLDSNWLSKNYFE